MNEIWKDIKNFEGLYQISNLGNIKSFHKQRPYLLKPSLGNNGYYQITLYQKNHTRKKFLVHRLVAEHFLANPNCYLCVNHKDENKLNNSVNNLEWCTYQYNNAYGTALLRSIKTKGRKVHQYSIDGIWIASYLSIGVASKLLNVSKTSIKDCCNGKSEFAYGYKWSYNFVQ